MRHNEVISHADEMSQTRGQSRPLFLRNEFSGETSDGSQSRQRLRIIVPALIMRLFSSPASRIEKIILS